MILYTQYMIVNCTFLVKCSETHTVHMPVLMRYTNQLTAEQDVVVLEQTVDYNQKKTEREQANSQRCHKIKRFGVNVWSCVDP